MDIKNFALERVITWILGGDLFKFIQELVIGVNDDEISGTEKKDYVFAKAKEFFSDVSTVLINIGIEVAVLLLRAKLDTIQSTPTAEG